jgi:3-phosphoglycerate kinase
MLGSSKEQFSYCTGKIIEAYAKAERCKTFTAGDHITGIAKLIGVDHLIDYFITGAKTTSYYITGKQLPGLGPFFK